MTVETTHSRDDYSGNDLTTAFPVTFVFYDEGDLVVVIRDDTTEVETVQTITTEYTVAQVESTGLGTVTMLTAPATGESLTIYRALEYTQSLNLVNNDNFDVELVERALDRLTFISQELDEKIGRSLMYDVTTPDADILDATEYLAAINEVLTDCQTALTAAELAQAGAETAETNAETAETNAETAEALAEQWASEDEDVVVADGEYSAKHYSIKAAASAASADVQLDTAQTWTAPQKYAVQALSIVTGAVAWAVGTYAATKLTVTGACEFSNPTGMSEGLVVTCLISNASDYEITFASAWKFPGSTVPTLDGTSLLVAVSDGTNMYCVSAADIA